MKKNLFTILLIIVFFNSCSNSDNASNELAELKIMITPSLSGVPIKKDIYYSLGNGDSIQISRLDFYLSNFTFFNKSSGIRFSPDDVFLYSLGSPSTSFSLKSSQFPSVTDSMVFLTGLNDEQNNGNPTKYESNHPLSSYTNMYWNDWTKYRYIVFNGTIKSTTKSYYFEYHTGLNYREKTALSPLLNISASSTTPLNIHLDIYKIFFPTLAADRLNYTADELQTHGGSSPSEISVATKVSKNFAKALSL